MKLKESVVMLIRDMYLHTYFTYKELFCSEAGKCYPYLMQDCDLRHIDEMHSRLCMRFDDCSIKCVITWKHSSISGLTGFVLDGMAVEEDE